MANTKLMVLCVVLVLGQQSLGVSVSKELDVEEVTVDERKVKEEAEDSAIMSKLKSIETSCKAAKRTAKQQLAATNTLIQLINETKTENCSAPVVANLTSLPTNCKEVLQKGNRASGVYTIGLPTGPLTEPKAVSVFCDMETDGGGWMVIQRRQDGSQDFLLGWDQYMDGFGDISNEFWLGNRALNIISTSKVNELRVDMTDGEGVSKYAKYAKFKVGSEAGKFPLTISGYTGNAGDSLSDYNGYKFTTIDQDNDAWSGNCATEYKGAWWYSACHQSNLNGLFLNGAHSSFADGMEWHTWHGYNYSIQFTEMKIRPVA